MNTAHAFTWGNGNVDVSLDTPVRAPRVSHDIVVSIGIVNTIANDDDGMIKLSTAAIRVENTTSVELEDEGVSFEGN